jgi:hypothetical protein
MEYHKPNKPKTIPYNTKIAEDHTLESLTIKVGKIYIYRHLNCCDHMIVFNNLRIVNSRDNLLPSNYPIQIF